MLKKWISSWLDDAPLKHNGQPLRLSLKKLLSAHDEMKLRLEQELAGIYDIPLVAEDLEKIDSCTYGQWLTSIENKKYLKTKEYKNALAAHTFYRQIVADVIYTHQAGNTKKAKEILNTGLKEASNLNQIELVRLYNLTSLN